MSTAYNQKQLSKLYGFYFRYTSNVNDSIFYFVLTYHNVMKLLFVFMSLDLLRLLSTEITVILVYYQEVIKFTF
jgi:hypothetical protein